MPVPFFYTRELPVEGQIHLSEESSHHISQVLRMESGERLRLTDGMGNLYDAVIVDAHKKHTITSVLSHQVMAPPHVKTAIAISLLKNTTRFEWFLEKATEMGIGSIIPLICERTEKQKFRFERMHGIMVSAILQSQQVWLPSLTEPRKFKEILEADYQQKFIAHCEDRKEKKNIKSFNGLSDSLMLIGPEGDFSSKEIDLAIDAGFQQISLGEKRLRTETAGMMAAAYLTHF
jgi:16S rRNA (uracil1498-N3)-methyltransferase